ncbi:MAG: magnesium/cobalt transporter CorA [Spirochaetaceae bacterium]|jgi:magnesium transporter|nr:magnesium/cobalt transporter CorA [Spirochaetaceae bacterium]
MELTIISYDSANSWSRSADTVDELLASVTSSGITWINVVGLDNSDAINRLAELYRIHPLTVEDILNAEQRPKVEEFDNYLFITMRSIRLHEGEDLIFERISWIIEGNTVITFQEIPGDSFDGIRRRLMNNGGRIRRMGSDYLAYILIDSVVDAFFIVLDFLGSEIEGIEDRAMDEKDKTLIPDVQRIKQRLLQVRRTVWPLRESVNLLLRLESPILSREMTPFLTDLHENVIQAVETVETYRELLAGVMEVNLSAMSNRMNQVMKVLTIISTIFIPMTFIVGVYGMNFTYMPELGFRYGYPITWGIMILIALGMIIVFKRRHWL